mgnify:CR=1 FL=1
MLSIEKMSRQQIEHLIWTVAFLNALCERPPNEAEDIATLAARKYAMRWDLARTRGEFEATAQRDFFPIERPSSRDQP